MSDFQNMLQELKDTSIDFPEAVQEKPKKIKNVSKKKDSSSPFSQKEMDALSQELLNYSAAYAEPVFNNKKTQTEVENIEKVLPIEVKDTSEVINLLNQIKITVDRLDKKITVNTHTEEANSIKIDESVQPLEIVKLLVAETGANEDAKYMLQTKTGVREISLSHYYDMSKFISMLHQYKYSMVLDRDTVFENELFNKYRDYLIVISQNILANSFRFFEKNKILNEVILLGKTIKSDFTFVAKAIDDLENIFTGMQNALSLSEYQKDFYFATLFNNMGFVLNAVTIMNEMLGEYIVESARTLSPYADERIQSYLDKIELSRSTRKAYYKFYTSARDFFKSHFNQTENLQQTPFFPFKDSGNDEIESQMKKLYCANKENKSHLFISYADLIDRIRGIRNDLAHGNNSRAYNDITTEINDVLQDFEYLAIKKNFLRG